MLLWFDGFGYYSTSQIGQVWDTTSGDQSISAGRFGNGLQHNGSPNASISTKIFGGSLTTLIVGFAFKINSWNNQGDPFMLFGEEGIWHLEIGLSDNPTNHLLIGRNVASGGPILMTSTTTFDPGIWHFVELKMIIHDTTGSLQLKIDDGYIENQTLSNLDTRNGGTPKIDRIAFGQGNNQSPGNVYSVIMDDLYICDTTGSVNNDFLGDCSVVTAVANGNGNSSQWVGSDGNSTDNYLLIDELSPSDSDYVVSSTVGNKDTYTFEDLNTEGNPTIQGVKINLRAARLDAGVRQIRSIARLSATEVEGPDQTTLLNTKYYSDIRETKPGGGSWAVSDFNSTEFGVKVST